MNNMKLILIIMLLCVIFCSEIVQQCQPIVENKHTTKELVNFEHIKSQFLKVCSGLDQPWVFDGEVMIIVRTCSSGGSGGSGGDIWSMGVGLELLE